MNTSSLPIRNPCARLRAFFPEPPSDMVEITLEKFVEDFQPNPGLRKLLPRRDLRAILCAVAAAAVLALGAPSLHSQTPPKVSKPAAIKSFRIVQEKDGPAVEILSTKPLVPSIQAVNNPETTRDRPPKCAADTQQKRIDVQADQISSIRANQFQENPPIARVVVDLLAARAPTPGTLPETDSSCISGRIPKNRTVRRFSHPRLRA